MKFLKTFKNVDWLVLNTNTISFLSFLTAAILESVALVGGFCSGFTGTGTSSAGLGSSLICALIATLQCACLGLPVAAFFVLQGDLFVWAMRQQRLICEEVPRDAYPTVKLWRLTVVRWQWLSLSYAAWLFRYIRDGKRPSEPFFQPVLRPTDADSTERQ